MLGLVMLFTKTSDLRPAGILISVAMRMSQRLQLHSSSSLTQFAANEGNERTRVFWVAYILDREISLRTRTPFIHCDTDIDVPLPTRDPEGHGTVWSSDGSSKLEFFRHRVELARLQGKIYDALFSSSALKLAPTERQKTVIKVDDMLNQWYSYIPLAFRLENAIQHAGEAVIISLTDMYHVYLSAIIITHGVYSRNAEWIQIVGLLGRAAIEDFAVALKGSRACTLNPNPPLPHAWDRCVNASRSCMKLFQAARLPDFYIYHSVCAHYSALLILLANNLIRPSHRHASADFQIAAISIELVDDTLHLAESPVYQSLHTVITDLFQRLNGTRGHAIQLWEGTPAGGDHATTEFQHSTQEHLGAHAVGAENDLLGFFETGGVLDGFGTDEIDLDFF
ncbi:unnamed protein product [Clonostachys rosea f. rosea IK726]|nr:unnamed protein product [Clonostachys rosea f. rosea IK726]